MVWSLVVSIIIMSLRYRVDWSCKELCLWNTIESQWDKQVGHVGKIEVGVLAYGL